MFSGTFRIRIKVALKILSHRNKMHDEVLKDFTNEKNVMGQLNHPNIVQLYAVSMDKDGNNLLVQELLESGSLLRNFQRLNL